jgi:hypothetical protein
VDKAPAGAFDAAMASPEKKSVSAVTIIIDLVLTAIAFGIFYWLVESHVPSNDPKMVLFFGASAAGCMAGVFWLAWQMLKVVYIFQRDSRK